MQPQPTPPLEPIEKELRRSFWQRRVDAFFGYDFFIAYAWADGRSYADGLARRLKNRGFECFLDTEGFAKGDDWKVVGAWALKRTTRLVLVGSPEVLASEPVLREVRIFTGAGKRVIPIDFDGSLRPIGQSDHPLLKLLSQDLLRIPERREQLDKGPSDEALKDIAGTFHHTRQSVKRKRWLQGFVFVLAILLALAVWQGVQAETRRREADKQKHLAEVQKAEAQFQARNSASRELAAAAMAQLNQNAELSIVLALHAVAQNYTFGRTTTREAADALQQALLASRVRWTFTGGTKKGRSVGFTASGNLVWLSDEGNIMLKELQPYGQLRIVASHPGASCAALSTDDSRVATADTKGIVKLWDTSNGKEVLSVHAHDESINQVALDPSGKWVVTASEDETAKMWDAHTGQLVHVFEHQNETTAVAFNSDGTLLAATDEEDEGTGGKIYSWDTATGKRTGLLNSHQTTIGSLAFHPVKNQLATAAGSSIAIWDLDTKSHATQYPFQSDDENGEAVSFSADGKSLITACKNGARIRDSSTGRLILAVSGHDGLVFDVSLSRDNRFLATAGQDGLIKVFDAQPEAVLLTAYRNALATPARALNDKGTVLYLGSIQGRLHACDTVLGFDSFIFDELGGRPAHDGPIARIALDAKEQWIASYGYEKPRLKPIVRVRDLKNLSEVFSFQLASVYAMAFSTSGKFLATGGADNLVKLREMPSGREIKSFRGHVSPIRSVAFSLDGRRLSSLSGPDKNNATGSENATTRSSNGCVRTWDIDSNVVLLNHNVDFVDKNWRIGFTEDGRYVVAANESGAFMEWDLASNGQLVASSQQPYGLVGFAYRKTGRNGDAIEEPKKLRIYALDIDEMISLARTRYSRNLTLAECREYLHTDRLQPLPWERTGPKPPSEP